MSKLKLNELVKHFNREKEFLKNQAQTLFVGAAKELFEKYPELASFGWEQYAPYFNDGDACVFSVYADYPTINDYDTGSERFVNGAYENEDGELTSEQATFIDKVRKPIAALINTLPDDIMQEIFGSDTRVTITQDGKITNDETSHD